MCYCHNGGHRAMGKEKPATSCPNKQYHCVQSRKEGVSSMKNRRLYIPLSAAALAVLLVATLLHVQSGVSTSTVKATSSGYAKLTNLQKRFLSGVVSLELNQHNVTTGDTLPKSYFPVSDDGCPQNLGGNIKVN